jgi:hypothetical protein
MFKIWEMLTSAPGALVKGLKWKLFMKVCVISALEIENFDIFK